MNALYIILILLLAPLFPGVINQTKAFFAGRRGPGVFRLYFDLAKLLRKSCPRATTSTWLFDLAPSISLASTIAAAFVFPWSFDSSPTSGLSPLTWTPFILFFYLLGTGRFLTVLGALDTGSAFEGMGASREVQFSALVEPAVFLILGLLVVLKGGWAHHAVPLLLSAIAFFSILLSECCRVPFDDPETHLELTMIHEAMILDNAGPDLAFIHYGAALKFELLSAFLISQLLPFLVPAATCGCALRFVSLLCGIGIVAILVGVVESTMARMRFLKTPQILFGTIIIAALGGLLLAI